MQLTETTPISSTKTGDLVPVQDCTKSSQESMSGNILPHGREEAPAAAQEATSPNSPSFVYALGRIEPRYPSPAVEKEFAQVAGRTDATGLTDRQTLQTILTKHENRYLTRQLCWVLTIEGVETYLLKPHNPADYDLLVEAVRPVPRLTDVDVIIGVRGPIAPPQMCNGLLVPVVFIDQSYSFDVDSLIKSIPKPDKMTAKEFSPAAQELFDRIQQLADNAGATDEHRALNYLAVRYPMVYATAAEAYGRNSSLSRVEVNRSRLSGIRTIMDVIFSFTNRQTDVTEKYFVRVDVTEEFPFLVTKMSPYHDR